jgi:CubicO group peptidase (beta-lactamase class C family)/alpha-L-fucosidase
MRGSGLNSHSLFWDAGQILLYHISLSIEGATVKTLLALSCAFILIALPAYAQKESTPNKSHPEQQQRLQWWREARFGMFIHWGPISLKGTEISWSRGGERRGREGTGDVPVDVYDNLYKQFNPVKFNAEQWVSIARAGGMKYMVLTAKHCDGFCLWRSGSDPYCMTNTPFGRDVCKELSDAAHRHGMHIGWYYSPMDWRDPDCRTERNEAYLGRMRGHLRELLSNYGAIDLLWFDTDGGSAPWDQKNTYSLVRSLQPRIIINNRLDMGSQEDYRAQRILPDADYNTPEQHVGVFDDQHPWETCMTIGTQWSWKPNDTIKTADECIKILVQCVTGDGNLLLNVGPMPNGEIEPRQVAVLNEIGAWLKRNGESIYGTRGGPFRNGAWGGSTRKGNTVYLHIFQWEKDQITLPPLEASIKKCTALSGGKPSVSQYADSIVVSLPGAAKQQITVLKLELDRMVVGKAENEWARTDSLMSSIYKNENPGAAIAVVKNGSVVFKRGYGVRDIENRVRITPSTNFNICSMTKQFTAYAILQLQRAGKLSLDDKLSRFFPDFAPAVANAVTVRQLLTHSSGIKEHYSYVNKTQYKEFWDKDVLRTLSSVDSVNFPSGSRYRYSNAAFCLLSQIIEKVSGESYPGYICKHLFLPLKMTRSNVIQPEFAIADRAIGYEFEKDSIRKSDAQESLFFSTMGDGGVYTSIDDYLKWITAIQKKRVLDPLLVKEAQSAQFPIDSARNLSYGFGWFVAGSGDSRVVYHTGSNGGFRTIVFTKPSAKYALVIFSNRTGVDLDDLIRSINRIYGIDDSAYVKLEDLIS